MKFPYVSSRLLAVQDPANYELRSRLSDIFKRYRSVVFVGRNDHLFTEHWTPERAAAGYDYEGFEIKGANVLLHGVEIACGFIYRISLAFPLELIDDASAIETYFHRQQTVDSDFSATPAIALSNPSAL